MNLKLAAVLGYAAYIENMYICLFCCISRSLKSKTKILFIILLVTLKPPCWPTKIKTKKFRISYLVLVVGWCNERNNYHSFFMSFKVCNPPHRDRCHGIFRMIRSVILLGNIHIIYIILLIIYTKFETDEMQLQVTNMQYACKQILCGGG